MAADWIKMRSNLWDDPRISQLCDMTGQTEATVIGCLYWLWATADQHTEDGVLIGMTTVTLNRKTSVTSFAESMIEIGWLKESAKGLVVVRFDEHNGSSAKKRMQTAKRVANHKVKHDDALTQERYQNVSEALPREREEKSKENIKTKVAVAPKFSAFDSLIALGVDAQVANDFISLRKRKRADLTQTALDIIVKEAKMAGITVDVAITESVARGWQSFKAEWYDGHKPKPYDFSGVL